MKVWVVACLLALATSHVAGQGLGDEAAAALLGEWASRPGGVEQARTLSRPATSPCRTSCSAKLCKGGRRPAGEWVLQDFQTRVPVTTDPNGVSYMTGKTMDNQVRQPPPAGGGQRKSCSHIAPAC